MPPLRRSSRLASKKDALVAVPAKGKQEPAKTTKSKKVADSKTTKTTESTKAKTPAATKKITKKTAAAAPAKTKAKAEAKPAESKAKTETKPAKTTRKRKASDLEDDNKENKEVESKTSSGLKKLKVGDKLPANFKLNNQKGKTIDLAKVASQSHVLIFFIYPRANTPGCTRQTKGFNTNYEKYQKLSTKGKTITIFGLSGDSEKAQLKFTDKLGLQFDLISDPKRELISMLGAINGSKIIRSHFIFVDGKLQKRDIKISPEVSINSALEYVQELVEGHAVEEVEEKTTKKRKTRNKDVVTVD
ncbi:unnamed protein product [Ambrosiozyma monospora]|uniref:Unnamed protein product n=1 Tax=Ambrosiozyma monospora TaxID=43982 RepID=A0ACB5SYD4_AMBMO|nr:unnamed protein product [Ambrosiozyma monospora]